MNTKHPLSVLSVLLAFVPEPVLVKQRFFHKEIELPLRATHARTAALALLLKMARSQRSCVASSIKEPLLLTQLTTAAPAAAQRKLVTPNALKLIVVTHPYRHGHVLCG